MTPNVAVANATIPGLPAALRWLNTPTEIEPRITVDTPTKGMTFAASLHCVPNSAATSAGLAATKAGKTSVATIEARRTTRRMTAWILAAGNDPDIAGNPTVYSDVKARIGTWIRRDASVQRPSTLETADRRGARFTPCSRST